MLPHDYCCDNLHAHVLYIDFVFGTYVCYVFKWNSKSESLIYFEAWSKLTQQ